MGVNYLTIKLRKDKFEPILKAIGEKSTLKPKSINNLVAGCVFFSFLCRALPINGKMTNFDRMAKMMGMTADELTIKMYNLYYGFLEAKDVESYIQGVKNAFKAEMKKKQE